MWRVKAKPRFDGHAGFRRDGIYFPVDGFVVLDDAQMTEAIKNEPMLIVEKPEAPKSTGKRR